MYDDATSLVDGYAKWMWCAFGTPRTAAAVATALSVVYVLPWLLVPVTTWAWVAALAGPAGRWVSAARTGGRRFPDPLAHPLSVLALAGIVVVSVRRHRRRALTWKSRTVA
jgi:heme exporter protein D